MEVSNNYNVIGICIQLIPVITLIILIIASTPYRNVIPQPITKLLLITIMILSIITIIVGHKVRMKTIKE